MQAYAGDTWKFRPNLTVTIGVQYVRDTGRSDSDLAAIPCSAVAASYGSQAPCRGSSDLLSHFGGTCRLGGRVRQPDLNFAPQFGLAWDPGKSGRTVIRAGIGMYYDNNVFRNLLADRVARVANGQFNAQANDPCASHGVVIFPGNLTHERRGSLRTTHRKRRDRDYRPANCFPGGQRGPVFKLSESQLPGTGP